MVKKIGVILTPKETSFTKFYLLVKSLHNVPFVYHFAFTLFRKKDMRLVYQALLFKDIGEEKVFFLQRVQKTSPRVMLSYMNS